MPTSLVCSNLVATPAMGQVGLTWSYALVPPNTDPSLQPAVTEIWAALTNDLTQAGHYGDVAAPGTAFTHIVNPQTGPWYYWIRGRDVAGNLGAFYPTSPTGGVPSTHNNIPKLIGATASLANGTLVVTAAASAITCAVKTLAGNDPSPSDPVFAVTQSASGLYSTAVITAALSVTIASGSSLGARSSVFLRVYWFIFQSGSSAVLAACNLGGNLQLYGTDTPIVDAGSSNSVGVFYSNSSIGAQPYSVIGYSEWTSGLIAGTWVAPTTTQLYRSGTTLGGDWILYNPNFRPGSGTFNSLSSVTGYYKKIGPIVYVTGSCVVVLSTGAGTSVIIDLPPVTADGIGWGQSRGRDLTTGIWCFGAGVGVPATSLAFTKADGTYPLGGNNPFSFSAMYAALFPV